MLQIHFTKPIDNILQSRSNRQQEVDRGNSEINPEHSNSSKRAKKISQENPGKQDPRDPFGGLLKQPWQMNTNYKFSEVGGNPENQAATLKAGICYGQPVQGKKKESTLNKKGQGRLRHKKVNKRRKIRSTPSTSYSSSISSSPSSTSSPSTSSPESDSKYISRKRKWKRSRLSNRHKIFKQQEDNQTFESSSEQERRTRNLPNSTTEHVKF